MSKIKKSLTISLLAVLLIVAVLPFSAVFAEMSVEGFDSSSIYEDLKDASILGKTFDINDYPVNENGTPELLAFVEFAFSLKHEYQPYYGLYLYVYYPQGNLVVDSELNNVEIANKYKSNGEANNWSKYQLKFLDKDYNGVLYKFKVLDSKDEPEHTIAETYGRVAMSSAERRYDIHSIELHQEGKINAVNYGIGGTWTITGYSQGMHDSSMEQSTLQSVATFQNTLKLDVQSTYFRAWQNVNNTIADQLSSVYFSVDNKIEQEYDRLYALKFQAFKYLSSPIFGIHKEYQPFDGPLLDYEQIYKNLLNQQGLTAEEVKMLDKYSSLSWSFVEDGGGGGIYYSRYPEIGTINQSAKYLDRLGLVFQVDETCNNEITSEQLKGAMANFSEKHGKDVRSKYSSILFSDFYYSYALNFRSVENGNNIGKTVYWTDTDVIEGSLTRFDFWDVIKSMFNYTADDKQNFDVFVKVNYDEIQSLSAEQISHQYLICENDVETFRTYVREQNEINKSVYLFRFDADTYCTEQVVCKSGICGYVAQEPIYLDFDIISLTYDKAGVQTVIPVVSNPIDIIAGIEPPGTDLLPDNADLVNLYMLVIIVLAIVLVSPLVLGAVKYILNIR